MGSGIRNVSHPDGGSSLVNLRVALFIGSNSSSQVPSSASLTHGFFEMAQC